MMKISPIEATKKNAMVEATVSRDQSIICLFVYSFPTTFGAIGISAAS
jgi:hypothetical protein